MSDQSSSASSSSNPVAASSGRLHQALGITFGIAVSVGNTISAGILGTPGDVATYLPSVPLFLGVWFAGGIYALIGSIQLAELGAFVCRSGGQYVFARRAIGPYAGFIVGWSDWLSTCGTSSTVSILIAQYLAKIFPSLKGDEPAIAVAIVLAFAALQWSNVKAGRDTQNITSVVKGLVYAAIVAGCFLIPAHASAAPAPASDSSQPAAYGLALAIMLALQSVIYTYDGWNGPIYFCEENKNPGREIPRAMFGGVFSVMAIYIAFNLALVHVLPLASIAGDDFAIGKVAKLMFGSRGEMIILGLMIAALLSAVNAYPLMATRVLFAMSRDGLVSRRFASVNAGGTPTVALVASTVVAVAFIAVKEFSALIEMMVYFFVANYSMSFLSLFILRRKEPDAPRPYRAWGYPFTTALALVGAFAFLVGSVVADLKNTQVTRHYSIYALGLLVLSYPVYRLMRREGYEKEGQ